MKTVKFWLDESAHKAFETIYFIGKTPTEIGVKTDPETLVPENIPPLVFGVNVTLTSFKQNVFFDEINKGSGLAFTSMFLYAESAQLAFEIKYFIGKIPVVFGVNSCALTLVPEKIPPTCVGVNVIVDEPIQTNVSDNVKSGFGLL